ncbi:peroxidase family protein, partial [Microvirga arabica]
MVQIVKHDLEFILKQIKIAEAHSAGTPLSEIYVDANGNVVQQGAPGATLAISDPLAPYGLRTVDGSWNNLTENRDQWGASDHPFKQITTPYWRDEDDDAMPGYVGPDANNPGGQNNNYGDHTATGQTSNGSPIRPGTVVDADPRIISNLIVDQTLNNPAAIYAALIYAGYSGAALNTALNQIKAAYEPIKDAIAAKAAAASAIAAATAARAAANADLTNVDKDALADAAEAARDLAVSASSTATAAAEAAKPALAAKLEQYGVEMEGDSVVIPNVAPDEGLSAPYNSWFTLFGQFFDHGLDLVAKKGGTIYIPLSPDDPLYNPASPRTNFMVLTRTRTDADNTTTPWVDQNQTYGSTASKQLFMRAYVLDANDKPVATGELLEGKNGGLATWADVKEQARTVLGIELTDLDVGSIPLFAMDPYGEFIRGPNGYPQLVVGVGPDGKLGTPDDVLVEGNPGSPVNPSTVVNPQTGAVGAIRTDHAFLDDIAHSAVPVVNASGQLVADAGTVVGNAVAVNNRGQNAEYDNELLDAHFITGDGRGNENIGLTAVHHVFHSEHNHMVDQLKVRAVEAAMDGDRDFLNEWLGIDINASVQLPGPDATDEQKLAFANTLTWDGERLFQAARFTTEMQYQHLVFEEFARKVQPDVDAFVFNAMTDIDPVIFAEFAHVVYRFGHSMLNQTVDRTYADGTNGDLDLFSAFLNPLAFGGVQRDENGDPILDANGNQIVLNHDQAAGAIVRGMTNQVGNEIDEFVTDVLRNQLLGIPLDLAAINIARGRDAGIPPLNQARREFQEIANGDTQLEAYTSWMDFALNLKNPASIVNFIAAYGTHGTIKAATTVEAKRDAAMKLVFGDASLDSADRQAFLNGTGKYARSTNPQEDGRLGGLEDIDLWVGGLAEKKMAFGGMLGSTFSFIFELQLENLQNADRFYYLSRVQGLNFLNELENNSFAKMVLNNTDLGKMGYAVPGDIFSTPDHVLYMDHSKQNMFKYEDPEQEDPFLQALSPMVERRDANGNLINPKEDPTAVAAYIRVNTNDHVLIQGTDNAERIISGGGDDSVWGLDGNDTIEAGYGVDKIHGGKGDDIITNNGTDIGEVDMLHGEEGNDVIHAGSGLALVFGNQGQDFLITGPDGKEAFGGTGNDFILGGEGGDFLLGNEGDDWIEAGNGFDTTAGDNSELFFNSTIIGHDVMFAGQNEHDFDAESGDDIMVQGESVMRNEGMWGFDWAIHKGSNKAADADLLRPIFTTDQQDILRNRYDQVEALSGWDKNDVLKGDNRGAADPNVEPEVPGVPDLAGAETTMVNHELTQAGVNRIEGMRDLLGSWVAPAPTTPGVDLESIIAFDDGNILLGGGGSDVIEGRGGNDVIDGDSWMNVRIRIVHEGVTYTAEGMTGKVYLETDSVEGRIKEGAVAQFEGKTLDALMLTAKLNPGQLSIVREIVKDDGVGDTDTAVYGDVRANYTITRDSDGSIRVAHNTVTLGLESDGEDKLWNIERLKFADQTIELSPPTLELNGFDPVTRTWADTFSARAYTNNSGTASFNGAWTELGDGAGSATAGTIQITTGGTLTFSAGNSDNASVTRTFNLAGATGATVTFSISDTNVGGFLSFDNEQILFEFAADGVNFVTLRTFDGDNGGNISVTLPTSVDFGPNAAIRFRANNTLDAGESFSVDNLTINATFMAPASPPSVDVTTAYLENAAAVAIASDPRIVDDGGVLASARIVLTNARAGDQLVVGNLPAGVSATVSAIVNGRLTATLTGQASTEAYQRAIQAVSFRNTGDDPGNQPRTIEVTVNDGILDSNVARTTVNVTPVNDAPNAVNDSIITNVGANTTFLVPEWALLANDSDPEGTLLFNAITGQTGLASTPTRSSGSVSVTDNATADGSFTYRISDGSLFDTATANVDRTTSNALNGTAAGNIIIANGNDNTIDAGEGNDIVFAGGGNDTVTWNATSITLPIVGTIETGQDGRDFVDGGTNTAAGDRFVVNGNGLSESFVVYSRAAAVAAGIAILRPETEIVITRNGAVIAELDNIEEITINTGAGNDSVTTIGDFSPTSLNFNTITIIGDGGDDTVDISALASAHRIYFRSNGGNDTIVGTLRPQDVIVLPNGAAATDYEIATDENGVTTMTRDGHKLTFVCEDGLPQFGSGEDEYEDEDDDTTQPGGDDRDEDDDVTQPGGSDDDDSCDHDDDGAGTGNNGGGTTPPVTQPDTSVGAPIAGTNATESLIGTAKGETIMALDGNDNVVAGAGADVVHGGAGNDFLSGEAGRDVMFGGDGDDNMLGGADADMLYGDAGNDRIFGDDGNDLIDAG